MQIVELKLFYIMHNKRITIYLGNPIVGVNETCNDSNR